MNWIFNVMWLIYVAGLVLNFYMAPMAMLAAVLIFLLIRSINRMRKMNKEGNSLVTEAGTPGAGVRGDT